MAALALPLISLALPLVEPFLQSAFVHLQALFGKGDPANALKITTAVGAVTPLLQSLQAAGIIPGNMTQDQVLAVVQAAFSNAKNQGLIPDVVTKVTPASANGMNPVQVNAPTLFGGTFRVTIQPG
jgi:hypothetical protein